MPRGLTGVIDQDAARRRNSCGGKVAAVRVLLEANRLSPQALGGNQGGAEPTEGIEHPLARCRVVGDDSLSQLEWESEEGGTGVVDRLERPVYGEPSLSLDVGWTTRVWPAEETGTAHDGRVSSIG